jgi:hypothetical protein
MTNKNISAKPVRIRNDQQTLDSANPTTTPALYELGTLGDGTVIVKEINGPNQGLLVTRDGTQIQSVRA